METHFNASYFGDITNSIIGTAHMFAFALDHEAEYKLH